MSSSSDEFTHLKKNSTTDVSVGFQRPYLCPSKGGQHGVSLQSFINLSIKYNAFPNISPIKYRTDPILGEAFCISLVIFFHFPDSGLPILTGLHLLYY